MTVNADVLVVGGGTSGAALAARLSENPGRSVVLAEAGPHYWSAEETPPDLLDGFYTTATAHDWGLRATLVPGVERQYLRGKATGGSSAINGSIALRPEPEDFDLWAEAGNDLWSWERMLPMFRRLERDQDFAGDHPDYHGADGPVPIRRWRPEELSTFAARFEQSLTALGHPSVADLNAPGTTGVGPLPMNLDGRVRVSTSIAYLHPAAGRPNLSVLGGHTARRLLVEGGRVVGAELVHEGRPVEIRAGEVILAAGAIGSPEILLRSGIGPAPALEGLGIACVADLPGVGGNLVEHPTSLMAMVPRSEGVPLGSDALAQVALRFTSPGSALRNDLQLFSSNGLSIVGTPQHQQLGVDTVYAIGTSLQYVTSTGRIALDPADPDGAPLIDFDCFSERADLDRAVVGVRRAWQAATSEPIAELWRVISPLDEARVEDDEAVASFVMSQVRTHYHAAGSCRMGPESDPSAVVDQHLRVRGVAGLRVADTSIMPAMVRANTNLTAIAIAERAAELVDA